MESVKKIYNNYVVPTCTATKNATCNRTTFASTVVLGLVGAGFAYHKGLDLVKPTVIGAGSGLAIGVSFHALKAYLAKQPDSVI